MLRKIPGAADVVPDQLALTPVLRIEVDEDAISRYGIARRDVLSTVAALGTPRVGEIREGQRRFPLVVRLAEQFRHDPEAVGQLLVSTPGGAQLPLARLAQIEQVETPTTIFRDWSKRRILVQCNVRGRDLGSFVAEAQQRIAQLQKTWPTGYHVGWGGQFEQMQRAQARLSVVVPLAALLIFVLLYASFHNVPRCPADLQRRALCRRGRRDCPLVPRACRSRSRPASASWPCSASRCSMGWCWSPTSKSCWPMAWTGKPRSPRASMLRLRPVLMTSATAALGFLPMMVAAAIGAEVQRPLATVVVGGVISSLLLTLLVLPVLYSLFGQAVQPAKS